jgi:hypothetical protein
MIHTVTMHLLPETSLAFESRTKREKLHHTKNISNDGRPKTAAQKATCGSIVIVGVLLKPY